jgi:hypothetical protein
MTNQQTSLSDEAILSGEAAVAPNDGRVAPLDGSQAALAPAGLAPYASHPFGPNNERLEDLRPDLVNALRELEVQYRQEGIVARRHEIRRIRQARLFWQGLQYAWWNPQDMTWHLPFESKIYDDAAISEMPRYQFVTNLYQAFGLSFVSILSQDVPATRFYPQSAQSIVDVTAAKAASQVSSLVEQNNRVQHLLTGVAFYLWTDGKIGGYVRYVADAQRFGSRDEPVIEEHFVPLGEDTYVCPECGTEQVTGDGGQGIANNEEPTLRKNGEGWGTRPEQVADSREQLTGNGEQISGEHLTPGTYNLLPSVLCRDCGASLGPEHFRPAERVAVPLVTDIRRVANGQEVISIVGGLELNTPVWAVRRSAILSYRFRNATTRSPIFKRRPTSTAFRRFMRIRKYWISTRCRTRPQSPPRTIRRERGPGSRWQLDFSSQHPRKFRPTSCGINRN